MSAPMAPGRPQVTIIGGGIVGVVSAAYLVEAGFDVTVIDRDGIGAGCSKGNAGGLSYTEILPLASPSTLKQSFGWLLDPLGPLYLPLRHVPAALPWLIRFALAARPARYAETIGVLSSLQSLARQEWDQLIARLDLGGMITRNGTLSVFEAEDSFPAADHLDLLAKHGVIADVLDRAGIAALEPALSPRFVKGLLLQPAEQVSDPYLFTRAIWDRIAARGCRFFQGDVQGISREGQIHVHLADERRIACDHLVIAAGAWSARLSRMAGDIVPIETERGYNTTIKGQQGMLSREVVFSRHGFVATPLESGLRIGGLDELAGLDAPANFRRAEDMLEKARGFLPGIGQLGGEQWMGHRPSTPDSLPVIGRSAADPQIIYAFGHGHLGLTLAAATGRLVKSMICREQTAIPVEPFAASRFAWGRARAKYPQWKPSFSKGESSWGTK